MNVYQSITKRDETFFSPDTFYPISCTVNAHTYKDATPTKMLESETSENVREYDEDEDIVALRFTCGLKRHF